MLLKHKNIDSKYLKAIIEGKKKYECRVYKDFWASLNIGDVFVFTDGETNVIVKVTEFKYFNNFGDAWFVLGDSFIPSDIRNVTNQNEASAEYSNFYTSEDIIKYGVVAVGLNVINY